tara:strand:- start:61 stop:225 length:165 start_codon:yes stop_codon:yes gene_type:complete
MSKIESLMDKQQFNYREQLLDRERDIANLMKIIERLTKDNEILEEKIRHFKASI